MAFFFFMQSPNSLVYEIDGDVNRLVQTDIILKQGKDMLEVLILEYIKYYIIRENTDIKFSLLTLI